MKNNIEIERKFKALEAEYIEEKQISALYHEIFSKQQKQIKSLQKAIEIFNSNKEKEHESREFSIAKSATDQNIPNPLEPNLDYTGTDFIVSNVNNNTEEHPVAPNDYVEIDSTSQNLITTNQAALCTKMTIKEELAESECTSTEYLNSQTQNESC